MKLSLLLRHFIYLQRCLTYSFSYSTLTLRLLDPWQILSILFLSRLGLALSPCLSANSRIVSLLFPHVKRHVTLEVVGRSSVRSIHLFLCPSSMSSQLPYTHVYAIARSSCRDSIQRAGKASERSQWPSGLTIAKRLCHGVVP